MVNSLNQLEMKKSLPSHFGDSSSISSQKMGLESQFMNSFFNVLDQVNAQQINAEDLQQKMVEDPSSVEAHTVSIAMAKAQTAVKLTSTIINKLTEGLSTLENLR